MKRRRLGAAFTALGVLIGLAVNGDPAQAAPAPAPAGGKAPVTVTLITGDQVTVEQGQARLRPGPHRTGITYFQTTERGHSYVYPSDAWPLVAAKRVDRRLFDVTGLLAQGYGDATKRELPLIVQHRGTGTLATTYQIKRVPKQQAATFWQAARAEGDIQTIWLDGKAKLSLDVSVPHIGAPTAWQAGLKGSGVKVAVLDTGYDPTHPDLKDAVVESKNFTNDPAGVLDTIGHGTHVASILAGRGTASGGRYTGVAPEASLLVGKVCADTEQSEGGPCPESAILAGMQWAAERGAKVVNLSLGGGPTDGTDPIATAVNTLSAQYGTLFVASSGNHYPWEPAERSVASPAAADSALAVASFSNTDQLSEFSNAGPRIGDFAIKPDLAAPGENIAAARAAQGYLGDPVDEHYTRLSGTSMSSPHAAGAAVLLAQQHPDWRSAELKAALMSTARDGGFSVYAQGAGRVDVARAVGQPVWASPGSLSLGYFRWPNATTPPASKVVTYHNDGATPVTLTLSQSAGDPFTLGTPTVTVPAHGTADVTVTATPGPAKLYGGSLVATDGGGTVVRTAIGAYVEPESYNLTVRTLDRAGARPEQYQPVIFVVNLDTGQQEQPVTAHGEATLRLPKGRYAVWSGINTGPTDRTQPSTTLGIVPEVQLGGDVTLNLDARQGRTMVPRVDRADARSTGTENMGILQTVAGETTGASAFTFAGVDLFAIPTQGRVAGFGFYENATLLPPQIELSTDRFAVPTDYFDVTYVPHFTGDEVLDAVDGGKGTAEDLAKVNVRGRLVLLTLDRPGEIDALAERVANVARAGGTAVQLTTWHRTYLDGPLPIPTLVTSDPAGQRLLAAARGGGVRVRLRGQETAPYQYNLVQQEPGRVPESIRVHDRQLAEVRTVYGAQGVDHALATVNTSAPLPGTSGGSPVWIGLPARRTELFSVGTAPGTNEPLTWWHGLSHEPTSDNSQLWGGSQHGRRGPYQAGGRSAELWNVGPFGPCTGSADEGDGLNWYSDELLHVSLPPFCDSQATHSGSAAAYGPEWSDAGSTVVTRDGVELGRSTEPGWAFVEGVAKAGGAYTVHVDATRSAPWTTLTSRLRADWAFTWADPDTRPTLLAVRYSTPLDEHNRGPGRQLGVWVEHGAAPVNSVRVEVSYDDGAHWSPTVLRRGGPGWTAALNPPRGAHYVSLRATATDTSGSRVTQEVLRAFALT